MDTLAPASFAQRHATHDDMRAILDVMVACDVDAYGSPDYTLDDLAADWKRPGFDPARDTWVLTEDGTGRIIAYVDLWAQRGVQLQAAGNVDPRSRGRGLGAALIALTEAPEGAEVRLQHATQGNDLAAQRLLDACGYRLVRHFSRMRIRLGGLQPAPIWAEGITLRTYVPGRDDRAVFDAVEESFAEHWGRLPSEFSGWVERRTSRAGFSPDLWLLAVAGDQVAGVALCRLSEGEGWVDTLGVRRSWRRRGVGMALLHSAFGAFHQRGIKDVLLGVDAQNTTGATHLYERAGMRVDRQFAIYQRMLREGRPPG